MMLVSGATPIGRKLETNGNETGNEFVSMPKTADFIGKLEDFRKRDKPS